MHSLTIHVKIVAVSRGLLCAEKHRVVAAVANKKLTFKPPVNIHEYAALWLKDWQMLFPGIGCCW
jgi:hypothetical protein